jgi:hypothetical protein
VFSAPTCDYGFRYRYKHFNANGTYRQPPSHSVGYLRESSFNNDGSLNTAVRYPYTSSFTAGYIRLTQPTNAYINVINGITTGDLFGVETRLFDNANPVTTLTVGVAKQRQIFNTPTSPYAFSVNHYINISTSGAIQGNSFKLDLRGNITIGGNSLIITQNYINSGSPGTTILNISSAFYISQILANNLTVELYFDGSNWRFFDYISMDGAYVPSSRTLTAGTGLTGGGNLSSDITISLGNRTDTIQFVIDGGGSVISTGQKGHIEVPFNCTVTGWSIFSDVSGSIVVDIWKSNYAGSPPVIGGTITGSEKPTLSSVQKNQDISLSTFTTSLLQGDILAYNVDSATTVQRVTVVLKVIK